MKKSKKAKAMIKLIKAINRIIDLEDGVKGPRGGIHASSKHDAREKQKNTMRIRGLEVEDE